MMGLEKIGVNDETGKLEVESTPCDNTLGDEVIEIEDTGTVVDKGTNAGVVEEFSWLMEENKFIRVVMVVLLKIELVLSGTAVVTG